ncbi:MAG TPA: BamA/TamA family outer membrane protein, partial [Gemmatimonadaceae bacterium]|nr:BamA/TamA family outer membrane protein [Gemmatimonadaceae bacterium]
RATPYSAWRSVLPRFWLPLAGQTAHGNYSLGAFTAGNDVVGRHSYFAQFLVDPRGQEHTWDVRYSYSGLGLPIINAEGFQDYDEQFAFRNDGTFAGRIIRRAQTYTLGMTLLRPRVRDNAFLTLLGELEQRHYTADPAPLLDSVDSFFRSDKHYWSIVSSFGWSNTQYPVRAISFEDGISFAATGQLKWLEGAGPIQSKSVSAVFDAYKSMNLGGFAHQVIAARVAGGVASGADPGVYDIGGSNGTPVSVFPGFTLGSRHTFAVRGFPSGIRSGDRVLAGSLEYRVPFVAPHRGLGFWPAFLDRTSINFFTDAGTAWNKGDTTFNAKPIASAGAEVEANLGLQYDAPYIARAGIAFPYINNSPIKVSPASVYFEIGFAF